MRTLKTGAYAATRPETQQTVIIKDAQQWESVVGGPPPAVDFEKEGVVVLFAGMKSSGGWYIEPKSAALEGDVLVVNAPVRGPKPEDMVTMALTYPFAAVAVDTRAFKSVRWNSSRA